MLFDLDLWLSHLLTAKAVIVPVSLLVAFTLVGMAWTGWRPGRRPNLVADQVSQIEGIAGAKANGIYDGNRLNRAGQSARDEGSGPRRN